MYSSKQKQKKYDLCLRFLLIKWWSETMDDNTGLKKTWLGIKSFKHGFIYSVYKGGIVMINLYLFSFSLK